jgi:multidrug efflux system outer membrane protein
VVFNDPVLSKLEADALAQNQQLASAIARLDEARARLGFAQADNLPTLSTTATSRLFGESSTHVLPIPPRPITYRDRGDTYRLPFDAAYEIDLWGRVRRSIESAGAQAEASEQDLAFVGLTITADVAQAWFNLRSLDVEITVLTRNIALRHDQIDINQSRFKAGITGELEVQRARVELANAEADLTDVRRRREQTANALAILTGRAPADFKLAEPTASTNTPPTIPVDLPSTLLQRRPDIISAERNLAARTAEIGVARAALFPTIRLTGSAGFESLDLGSLLSRPSQFWQVGPSLSYPIIDGGRNRANIQAAEARARGALADYQQKVLVAFREVEDALIDLRQQSEQADALTRALNAARAAAELSNTRYEKGLINYLEVVDAQRSELAAERALAQLAGARYTSTVRLIKALGGGWSVE